LISALTTSASLLRKLVSKTTLEGLPLLDERRERSI
jgi:hypothetical protein